MALRYTSLQSRIKVDVVGAVTMTAGPDDLKVIDLTAAPYSHGFRNVMIVLQDMSLSGAATLVARGNTATNGSGTDTTLQTMAIGASDTEVCLEIPADLMGAVDENKSLVFDIDGENTDTLNVVIVAELLYEQDGLTPSDVTAVT